MLVNADADGMECWYVRIDTAVVLGVVRNLGPFTPDNLAVGGDHTQLGDVDFEDCSLGQDTELSVQGVLGVLLDGEDGQLHGDGHFRAEQSVSDPTELKRRNKHTE
jgi:hypothetical protein